MQSLRIKLAVGVAVLGVAGVATAAIAHDRSRMDAFLTGYQEPPAISTGANGSFKAQINRGEDEIRYSLVYNGPFKAPTLRALFGAIHALADEPGFGDLPVLWIHGQEDALAPLEPTRAAFEHLRGSATEEKVYSGARHEIFNETNSAEVLDDLVAFIHRAL